ncbi:hypothetical protein IPA_02500 [Ignicoccus pacificus DSM 13166]|uniref:Uncharacterized protein n=1 Tax=Ignicoccus pacificus DSM 13166 TaxID=940294 RepID=A0A977PLC8_9CREN|nr:hypothetical protein IPA_02500 [Ignicoccus pacificus DSM 13166]
MQIDLVTIGLGLATFSSSLSAILAASAISKSDKLERGIRKVLKELNKRDEETIQMIIEAITAKDTLSQKTVLAIVEAARLLAEDARRLYEETGREEFLKVAERWETFVQVNRKAVEKVLGYREELKVSRPVEATA